ncbi:protein transport protein Sec31A-like isoform X1 [Mercenaria mercenaria]|uniref:protein transport protein Sec31A-like isoform X1 n=1 Tax=Mercenaria mercenaria TaxID=6596 RepID=UPI00234E379C|nr:protein transport protein Sec31A-like isoform X1 [Mercenaria mercenaria]XP_053393358.1 protein transport protein Sec31A-like isoform X1 [Mercenaria mercenaria]
MKVKEIGRTANIAWSPQPQHPVYMVAGTAAQQLDATFSTSAALELYSLNLGDPSLDMPLVATVPSDCRFHKVAWGCYDVTEDLPNGVIVGGADSGGLMAYDASKFIKGDQDCLMFKKDKHTGAVKALDFNPFQNNLLVSGGAESEIFIWDMNNPDSPMTPGAKSQPPEEVACVSWNRQVQHILASTFTARCVVWDLRKNEPIIKVSDSMSRIKPKLVSWNPEVATQMCLSSEDDHAPVIQLWDLRYATSPVKVLENHQRGVLSMAWCPKDPDLLLSCAKDNRILCWNPNSSVQNGEVVYEIPTSHQWSFDVQWCPRNPNVISSSSFDGSITCYSLMGGGHPIQQTDKVTESFHSSDPFTQAMHSQQQQQQQEQNVMPLQKPPKWLKKPVGANFGFGGKLVSFENVKPQNPQQPVSRQVTISQVLTETDLVTGSLQLEQALNNNQHVEFCAMKAANSGDSMQESIWNFLMVNFEKEPRERYIQMLGYDKTELATKVSQHTKSEGLNESVGPGVDANELVQKMNQLGTGEPGLQGLSSSGRASPNVDSKTPGSRDELHFSDGGSSAFDEIGLSGTQASKKSETPLSLSASDDADGLLCQALLTGNFEAGVDMCLCENKMAEAILLAIAGGPELLSRTQQRYFQKNGTNLGRLVSAIVTHDWRQVVNSCELDNWKEALAVILTYSPADEFSTLCDTLAARLENEGNGELSPYAGLCYICSGNVEKMVENWFNTTQSSNSPMALQDLVEKVMLLRKAVETSRGQAPEITTGIVADKLSEYAGILSSQGCLDTALRYLGESSEHSLAVLRDRLYQALSVVPQGMSAPQCPWQKVNVAAQQPAPRQQQPTTYQATANSTFNTTTTGTYTSHGQYSNQYPVMNGPTVPTYSVNNPLTGPTGPSYSNPVGASSVPTYGGQVTLGAPSSPTNKGPLAHKYPNATTGGYGGAASSGYGVNTYNPMDYNTQPVQPAYNYGGQYPTPAVSQPSGAPSNMYNSGTPGYGQPPSGGGTHPNFHSFQDSKPDKAWNDPPMVMKKDKPKPQPSDPAPITNPIYGSQPQVPDQSQPGSQMNYGNFYNPQEYKPEPQKFSTTPQPTYTNSHVAPKPAAPEPVKEVPKAPIPEEHKVLQDIFNNLVHNCQTRANNAQMKRKLDDVMKKLEILYDRLREGTLSPAVIQGLHQIVQTVQQYDYNTGLAIYTQMVSQGNFSEISSFMPGLKMLIQSASHLQVYVQ